jgi:hypothetical protein
MKYVLLFLMVTTVSYAALPPMAQSAAEIRAILDDPRLHRYLGSEAIEQITHKETGYLISTRHYQIGVDVIYHTPKRIGPASFSLEFGGIIKPS